MQVDFGEKDVLVNGAWLHLHFFVCKLGYSRRVFAKAYYLNFPKNLHSNTGTGDYFPKKVISS